MIKVWELSGKPQAFASIQTLASVARVNWRPGFRWQLSSCALLVDFNVCLWDLHRPYLPVATFGGHKDVTTKVAWRSSSSFLSSSKDNSIIMHSFRDAVFPADSANPVALSWSAKGDLSFIGVRERDLTPPGTLLQNNSNTSYNPTLTPQHMLTASQTAIRDNLAQHGSSAFASQLFNTSGGEYSSFVCRPRNKRGRALVQDPIIRVTTAGDSTIFDLINNLLPNGNNTTNNNSSNSLTPSSSLSPSISFSGSNLNTLGAKPATSVEYKVK